MNMMIPITKGQTQSENTFTAVTDLNFPICDFDFGIEELECIGG